MIDARELRIGNWVLSPHLEPYKIDQIRRDSLNNFPHWLTESDPIPLTEDILLKCGFEKSIHDTSDGMMNYWEHSKAFALEQFPGNPFQYRADDFVTVRHLHQLQNLFYCLCGTELEITF